MEGLPQMAIQISSSLPVHQFELTFADIDEHRGSPVDGSAATLLRSGIWAQTASIQVNLLRSYRPHIWDELVNWFSTTCLGLGSLACTFRRVLDVIAEGWVH